MEVKSDPGNHGDRMKIMKTLIIDGQEYNYGTILLICAELTKHKPHYTSRITPDAAVRQMLLQKKVIAPTAAYPAEHGLCRFVAGEKLQQFFDELEKAEEQLQAREPLNNPEKNQYLALLSGPTWGIDPARDALGSREDVSGELYVQSFAEAREPKKVLLRLDSGEEWPYDIMLTPEEAAKVGDQLYLMARSFIDGNAPSPLSFQAGTEMEIIEFTADLEGTSIELTGEGWEEAGVTMTPNQAEQIAWDLREGSAFVTSA